MRKQLRCIVTAAAAAALLLADAPAANADRLHDPTVDCWHWVRFQGEIVFAGEAHAPAGHVPLLSLSITCRYLAGTATHTSTTTSSAPVVTTSGSGEVPAGTPIVVCESAIAHYADGHVGIVPEECVESTPHETLPPAYSSRCDIHRTAAEDVVIVYAVAETGPGIPVSTRVRCTLVFTAGQEVTVEAANEGAVAAGTGAAPPFPVVRGCLETTVTYPAGEVRTNAVCWYVV